MNVEQRSQERTLAALERRFTNRRPMLLGLAGLASISAMELLGLDRADARKRRKRKGKGKGTMQSNAL